MIRSIRRSTRDADVAHEQSLEAVHSQFPSFAMLVSVILLTLLAVAAVLSGGLQEVSHSLSVALSLAMSAASQVFPALGSQSVAKLQDKKLLLVSPRHIVLIADGKGGHLQIVDEPIPDTCHARQHADFAGDGVRWGLGHKVKSAAECCRRCQAMRGGPGLPCNVWTWCGDPSGVCWTMDIHNHTTGDCWLKFQKQWDNVTDFAKTNLEINHMGRFSDEFRREHKTAPEFVPWVSGLVAP